MSKRPKPPRLQEILNTSSGAPFFILIWEWSITLDDEVEHIWSKPNGSWLKWLFLFSRYYVLAASTVSRSIEAAVIYQYDLSWSCMKIWYSCQVLVALHATVSLEVVLMSRVYALYNRQKWMWYMFGLLLVMENVIVMTGMFVHYPSADFVIWHVADQLPPSFSYFGFCTLLIQLVIMYLTLAKYFTGAWKSVPIVQLMFRDGVLSFTALALLILVMAICNINGKPFAPSGYSWLLAAISVVTCRLIINMQRLPRDTGFTECSDGIEFTSVYYSMTHQSRGTISLRDLSSSIDNTSEFPRRPQSSAAVNKYDNGISQSAEERVVVPA